MKKGGLSLEQERAAQLISLGKKISDKEISKDIGISVKTLASWRADIRFKLRVLQLFEDNMEAERIKRSNRIRKYLKPIYEQIIKKIKNKKNLEVIPLKELIRMMAQLHNELRFDAQLAKKTAPKSKTDTQNGEGTDDEYYDSEEDEDALMKARSLYSKSRKEADDSKKVVKLFAGADSE